MMNEKTMGARSRRLGLTDVPRKALTPRSGIVAVIAAGRIAFLDHDQHASYLALCEDVLTIVGVAGFPPTAGEDGRAVLRAYACALDFSTPEDWHAYHRAVTALLTSCAPVAAKALNFSAVAACMRLRAFLRENPDLAARR